VPLERIPYYVPAALEFLKGLRHIVTVETGEPVAFFSYPDKPSQLKPSDCTVHPFVSDDEHCVAGLEMLAEAVWASNIQPPPQQASDLRPRAKDGSIPRASPERWQQLCPKMRS
jgi:acetolactate synthase-1/2/3 large subunit